MDLLALIPGLILYGLAALCFFVPYKSGEKKQVGLRGCF